MPEAQDPSISPATNPVKSQGEIKHEYASTHWDTYAEKYHNSIARFTAQGGAKLIDLSSSLHPYGHGSRVLDLGAGSGRMTLDLAARFPDAEILATDASRGMLDVIAQQQQQQGARVCTTVVDARDMFAPTPSVDGSGPVAAVVTEGTWTHVLSTFMIQFLPDPEHIAADMYRALAL